jgi:hypothetical protein
VSNPGSLLNKGADLLKSSPEFEQLRERMADGGRSAVGSAASGVVGRAAQRIGEKADALEGSGSKRNSDGPDASDKRKAPAKKSAPAK